MKKARANLYINYSLETFVALLEVFDTSETLKTSEELTHFRMI
jgi:hypothetical protein